MSEYLRPALKTAQSDVDFGNQTQTHGKQCNCLTAGEVTPVEIAVEQVEGYAYQDVSFDFEYFVAETNTPKDK